MSYIPERYLYTLVMCISHACSLACLMGCCHDFSGILVSWSLQSQRHVHHFTSRTEVMRPCIAAVRFQPTFPYACCFFPVPIHAIPIPSAVSSLPAFSLSTFASDHSSAHSHRSSSVNGMVGLFGPMMLSDALQICTRLTSSALHISHGSFRLKLKSEMRLV